MVNQAASQSCKNIWVLLSGSSVLKSSEFISLLLKQNAPQLVRGILYHKQSAEAAKSTNAQLHNKFEQAPTDFIDKLARLTGLQPFQAYDLFLAFLLYEYKGPKSIQGQFTNEKSTQALLHQLYDFYLRERLFSLFCLKQILSNWHENSHHPYRVLFASFVTAVQHTHEPHALATSLLDQFDALVKAEQPNHSVNGPYLTDQLVSNWIRSNLRETFEILQNLLIYLQHFQPSVVLLKRILSSFQTNIFYTRYQYAKQLAGLPDMLKYEQLQKLIGFIQALIVVRALQLDLLPQNRTSNETDNGSKHYLFYDPNHQTILNELNELILSKCNLLHVYSPVLLAWLVVRSVPSLCELPDSKKLLEYLGSSAFRLNVFELINQTLVVPEFQEFAGSEFASTVKITISQLLSGFFCNFDLDILGNKLQLLYSICNVLFEDNLVVESMLRRREDCGLFLIFARAFSNINSQLRPLLEMCQAITSTSQCDQFLNVIAELPYYTESYEPSSGLVLPTDDQNVYQLQVERYVLGDTNLAIAAGNLGMKKESSADKKGILVIEWHNVNLDGLRLLVLIFRDRMDKLLSQTGYSTNADFTSELGIMNNIFAHLLRCCPQHVLMQNIPSLIFYSFKLFTKHHRVPRLYIASILRFFHTLISIDRVNEQLVWDQIIESGFFPYMIGLIKDRAQLCAGQDTNASKIGELIMSEECMEGHYDLCCAYLNLLSNSFPTQESTAKALLIHIISEIFPSFQQWHYRRPNQCKEIAYRCLTIFQNVLSIEGKNKKLPELCQLGLLSGPAGETLLSIIVKGESLVRETIETTGNSRVLIDDQLVIMIRHSLSVLNRLLRLQDKKGDLFKKSAVEQALFSTQNHRPNMILVLTHYVFQRYDPRLATLAVTLLKRLSKHFPMSLLACLGSDAESVRDHFLYRIEELTEDLILKIALLDFLSCCIKHQPGLIEMFLNSDGGELNGLTSSSENGASKLPSSSTDQKQRNCLQTVLEILEEKYSDKYDCPPELHSAAIKFVFTFWIQPHLLAIDSLKKTPNLWRLICFPITKDDITQVDEKLFGNILRILAREVFYIRTLEKEYDPQLKEIFAQLAQQDQILVKLASYLGDQCARPVELKKTNVYHLLNSWRDFLVSISKYRPFDFKPETLKLIFNRLLDNLVDQLQLSGSPPNHELLQTLGEICIVLVRRYGNDLVDDKDKWKNRTTTILYMISEKKDALTLGFLISVESLLSLSLKAFESGDLSEREPLKNWYSPWCNLFKFAYQVLEKNVQNISEIDLRLANNTLGLFHCLVNLTQDIDVTWLSVVRNNLILESMVGLLCYLIESRTNQQLIETIMHTFLLLSTVPSSAHLLQITRAIDKISTSLATVLNQQIAGHSAEDVRRIFELLLQLTTSLLMTIKHHFVEAALNLVQSHHSAFVRCLRLVRESPFKEHVQQANHILAFLTVLTPYRQIWMQLDKESYQSLMQELLKTTHSLIAFLIRPNLLQYTLKNRANINSSLLRRPTDLEKSRSIASSRVISFDLDLSGQLDSDVHQDMFKLLLQNLIFLNLVTPSFVDIASVKENAKPCVETIFSAPNIDVDKIASFGSLLYCISLVIRLLNKFEKMADNPDQSSAMQQLANNKDQLITILEASLTLIVSQALLAQESPDLSDRDKQAIRRDLKTELGSMLLPKSRHSKRNLNTSLNSSIHKSLDSSIFSNNYIKFIMDKVDELFKN